MADHVISPHSDVYKRLEYLLKLIFLILTFYRELNKGFQLNPVCSFKFSIGGYMVKVAITCKKILSVYTVDRYILDTSEIFNNIYSVIRKNQSTAVYHRVQPQLLLLVLISNA